MKRSSLKLTNWKLRSCYWETCSCLTTQAWWALMGLVGPNWKLTMQAVQTLTQCVPFKTGPEPRLNLNFILLQNKHFSQSSSKWGKFFTQWFTDANKPQCLLIMCCHHDGGANWLVKPEGKLCNCLHAALAFYLLVFNLLTNLKVSQRSKMLTSG